MLNQSEKRRALNNAIERLNREGSEIIGFAMKGLAIPVITIEMPPTWLLHKAIPMRERVNGQMEDICVARLSGCIVRWLSNGLPEAYQITQNLNPYAPELIAQWPANF
ncbi:hypothetical protein [Vibrio parahaemolyticus]|uniref:hypothetical protein n=1 Tax=Vibrio parahaemolyticus TaxID=670 RepID=UPI0015DBE5C7|nr:hypothetical protein [Vibrio parahaemolyticus]MBE4070202.1 hypothetical protein [Vibrio parahaemolyticus]MDZ5116757.1 hypothetical protein [Vibrio parahaemolyticus]QLK48417.1 hypothetical protein DR996_25910 [Vibrio owensii]WCZ04265.1 hypothetical protein GSS61_24620 [Vibrio parahaemolyticus]